MADKIYILTDRDNDSEVIASLSSIEEVRDKVLGDILKYCVAENLFTDEERKTLHPLVSDAVCEAFKKKLVSEFIASYLQNSEEFVGGIYKIKLVSN